MASTGGFIRIGGSGVMTWSEGGKTVVTQSASLPTTPPADDPLPPPPEAEPIPPPPPPPPSEQDNLLVHFDAQRVETISDDNGYNPLGANTSTGTAVGRWHSTGRLTGMYLDIVTQGVSYDKTRINGRPAVYFENIYFDQYHIGVFSHKTPLSAATAGATMVMVFVPMEEFDGGHFWHTNDGGYYVNVPYPLPGNKVGIRESFGLPAASGETNLNITEYSGPFTIGVTPIIYAVVADPVANATYVYLSDSQGSRAAKSPFSNHWFTQPACVRGWGNALGEFRLYDAPLTAAQLSAVVGDLRAKWGIP